MKNTEWVAEAPAGFLVGLATFPQVLAAALLAFQNLGSEHLAASAQIAVTAGAVGIAVVTLFSNARLVIGIPLAGPALILGSLITELLRRPALAEQLDVMLIAAAICVLFAGLWQILFALVRLVELIKYMPHPVLAGFLNGFAVLIMYSQVAPHLRATGSGTTPLERLELFGFMFALVGLIFAFPSMAKAIRASFLNRVPAPLWGLLIGIAIYHLLRKLMPQIDLGSTIGTPISAHRAISPFLASSSDMLGSITEIMPTLLAYSAIAAGVSTLETLLALRLAQNLQDIEIDVRRELTVMGAGNCLASLIGASPMSGVPSLTVLSYSNGGRSRRAGAVAGATVLFFGTLLSGLLGQIPIVALSAVLIGTTSRIVDRWSLGLPRQIVTGKSADIRRHSTYELAVVLSVMAVTVLSSIIAGMLVGLALSAIIFIVRMSQPVIRRAFSGDTLFSKRVRSNREMAVLRATADQRLAIELQGVLFFGNAESLGRELKGAFEMAELVAIDFTRVTDIDVSGANVVRGIVERAAKLKRRLLLSNLSNVLSDRLEAVGALAGPGVLLSDDLDSALEWMEQQTLGKYALDEEADKRVNLSEVDFVEGLDAVDLRRLERAMMRRHFPQGTMLCHAGEEANSMWLMLAGSVSVRVLDANGKRRRIASLGHGTTVGEMALIDGRPRSAELVADEAVDCYELSRDAFETILRTEPSLASRLLFNIAKQLVHRLRDSQPNPTAQ
jgi:MFS superfamily sulfate permease-like transporter/CRP-like cAMP-binding protein